MKPTPADEGPGFLHGQKPPRMTKGDGQITRALLVFGALILCAANQARADYLFYGGDWYGNGTGNGTSTNVDNPSLQSNAYQNFIVPVGQTWTVTGLFSNNLVDPAPTNGFTGADWFIRSGVSAGNGGTLIASGTNALVTIAPTGRSFGSNLEETFTVSVPDVILGSGTYWMNVTPVANDGTTYNTLTTGTNSIGSHHFDDDFGFVSISGIGVTQDFVNLSGTYSDGVEGSLGSLSAVPVPPTLTLLGIGAVCSLGYGWRRWKQTKA